MKFKIEIPRKNNTPLEVVIPCQHIDPRQVDFNKEFKILGVGYDETKWEWPKDKNKNLDNSN